MLQYNRLNTSGSSTLNKIFEHTFTFSVVGMALLSNDGHWIKVNPTLCNILGYTEQELLNTSILHISHPVDLPDHPGLTRKLNNRDIPCTQVEMRYKHKKGHYIACRLTSSVSMMDNSEEKLYVLQIEDMSRQQQVKEKELHIQEHGFWSLAENSTDIIIRFDPNFRRIYVNPAFKNLSSSSPSEVQLPDTPQVSLQAHIVQALKKILKQVMETALPKETELEWLDTEGEYNCFHLHAVPEFDEKGHVKSMLAIARDHSKHKTTEKLLAQKEQEYRSLYENSPFNIARFNHECKCTFGNTSMLAMFREKGINIIGKTPLEAFPKGIYKGGLDEIVYYMNSIWFVLSYGENREMELKVLQDNGKFGVYHIVFTPEKDIYDNIIGVLAFGRDVTEQKRTENKLKETQSHLSTIISTIPDLVWLKDTEGKFLSCNKAVERFLGAPESQILGKTDYDFVDKELADFFRTKDQEAILAGKVCMNEESIIYATDGCQRILETRKVPMYNTLGEVSGVLGIARDITDRKHAEEALVESEKKIQEHL